MKLQLPINLNPKSLKTNLVHKERILILLHHLLKKELKHYSLIKKSLAEVKRTHFHSLDAETLMVIFGRQQYRKALEFLKDQSLLKVDEFYQFGAANEFLNRPKQYQIPEHLIQGHDNRIYYSYEMEDRKSINAKRKLDMKISTAKQQSLLQISNGKFLASCVSRLNLFELDVPWFECTVDSFGHRFHSPVTNMKKELRSRLRFMYLDNDLYEIDLVSSQPYFISQLNHHHLFQILPAHDARKVFPIVSKMRESNDFKVFRDIIRSSDIYEFWGEQVSVSERKEIKELFFTAAYGNKHQSTESAKLFDKLFGEMNRSFLEIKSQKLASNPSQKRYSNLVFLIQRFESHMCLGKVIDKARELGIEDIVTVHDSWIVKNCDVEMMEFCIEMAFRDAGLDQPKIRISKLSLDRAKELV